MKIKENKDRGKGVGEPLRMVKNIQLMSFIRSSVKDKGAVGIEERSRLSPLKVLASSRTWSRAHTWQGDDPVSSIFRLLIPSLRVR